MNNNFLIDMDVQFENSLGLFPLILYIHIYTTVSKLSKCI